MKNKPNPKIKELNEKEREAWEEKMRELQSNLANNHITQQINQGRGWIF